MVSRYDVILTPVVFLVWHRCASVDFRTLGGGNHLKRMNFNESSGSLNTCLSPEPLL